MAYNKETWINNNKDKLINKKCKFCNAQISFGGGLLKDVCRKCYNLDYYLKNQEKLIKSSIKRHKYTGNKYYQEYLKNNPEEKNRLSIRQMTYHKYGKAKICLICKSEKRVQHHHFEPYSVDNFIDLCSNCHKRNFHRKHFNKSPNPKFRKVAK